MARELGERDLRRLMALKRADNLAQAPAYRAMQEEIAARMSEKLNEAQAVMADSASGEAEKEAALQTIEENETISQLQQQTIDHLKEKGWDCAVEISDGVCRVTLFGQEEAKETVTQVMNETYSVLNGNYLIEVAFKSA